MIFINYHLIKLELRQYHPDMEFWVDGLRNNPPKKNFAIPFPFPIFATGLAMNQAVHID